VRIEADLQASGPLTLCADGTMTVDLSLAATATGPVDLFLYRGAMIAVADPVAARDAAETAAGSVVRISPGSMEMVVVVAPPGTAALHAVLIGYRLEAAADDPDERIEIPAAAAPLAVGDAGC